MVGVDEAGNDDVARGVEDVVGLLADLLPATDKLDDLAVLDHDPALGALGEHRERILDPEPHRQPAFAAIASTSTRNSGRVKPATIISVEAGGGSATKRSRTLM